MTVKCIKTALAMTIGLVLALAPILQAADQAARADAGKQQCCCCAGCSVDTPSPQHSCDWSVPACPCEMKSGTAPLTVPLHVEIQRITVTDESSADEPLADIRHADEARLDDEAVALLCPAVKESSALYLTCCSLLI